LRTRYHSAIDTRHYGRASDVLRYAILLQEGGIYMDTDVTCLKKLPVGISAPEGLLIGHGQSFYINALTNAVMAAPKRSETVSKLMGAIGGQFNRYDQKRW
jgi:mannosyltransferase OCH1-like enzyme